MNIDDWKKIMNIKDNEKKTIIYIKVLSFFSYLDRDAFYYWINRLKFVTKWKAEMDYAILYCDKRKVNEDALNQFEAIFMRYKFENIEQLKIFFNKRNRHYFYLQDWFWEDKNIIINSNEKINLKQEDPFRILRNILHSVGNPLNGGYHWDVFLKKKNIYRNYYNFFDPQYMHILITMMPYYYVVSKLSYASKKDENIFFKKLEKIPYIKDFVGLRWKLYIFFDKEKMSDDDYSECENLCKQYHGKIEKIVL